MINDLEGNTYIGFESDIYNYQVKKEDKLDDFEIIDKLGEGSFGMVLKVR